MDGPSCLLRVVNTEALPVTYSYDAANRKTVKRLANGARTSFSYDAADRITQVSNLKGSGVVISQFDYRYDNTANRIGVTEASGDRVTWTYDATYQLTRERRSGVNGYDVTHVYDPAGNRTLKLDGGSRTTSVYNGANQIVWSQDGSGRTTITYDADGNLTREVKPSGQITTSVWDAENMNSAVLLPDTTRVTYTYNADHLRVRKDTATGTRKYVFDLQNPFTETDGSDVTQAVYVVEPQT
jgi:YD repeat-containing protein